MSSIKKTISYLKRNGIKKTYYMIRQRLLENAATANYEELRKSRLPGDEELKKQSERAFTDDVFISVLVPAFNTPAGFLTELVDSVLKSSFKNFELLIADASTTDIVRDTLAVYSDERIVYHKLDSNYGISGNTNEALRAAKGNIVALLDHDDYIEPDALYYIADAFSKGALIAYTDEDKVVKGKEGPVYFKPHFKTDFNRDILYSNNYICHMFSVRRDIALATGGERAEYDGAQDYDFILRCIEQAELATGRKPEDFVAHIDRVLYHWRVHEMSTAENPESKLYAYEAGRRALKNMFDRRGLKVSVKNTEHLGFYYTEYETDGFGVKMDEITFVVPDGATGLDNKAKRRALSLFTRKEVRAVVFRVLDKHGRIMEEPYKGMKYWDSGVMHRAALVQNVSGINGSAYCTIKGREEGIIVYDPTIVLKL